MRKLYFLFLLAAGAGFFAPVRAQSLCTPDTSLADTVLVQEDAYYISPSTYVLPTLVEGQPYSATVKFLVVDTAYYLGLVAIPVKIKITDIENLPAGLNFDYVSGNPADNPIPQNADTAEYTNAPGDNWGPYGCVHITGTPICPDPLQAYIFIPEITLWFSGYLGDTTLYVEDGLPFTLSFEVPFTPTSPSCTLATSRPNTIDGLQRLQLSPNPAQNLAQLQLQLSQPLQGHWQVLNTLGQPVSAPQPLQLAAGAHNLAIPLFGLPAGLYHVVLQANGVYRRVPVVVTPR